jgi:hypothetical protein
MKIRIWLVVFLCAYSSCAPYRTIAKVKMGGFNNGIVDNERVQKTVIVKNDVDGGTYIRYLNDSTGSNIVELTLQDQEGDYYNTHHKRLRSKAIKGTASPEKSKSYAFATIKKAFYQNGKAVKSVKCRSGECIAKTYDIDVLMTIVVKCKNDQIHDTISVFDNFPEGAKLAKYTVLAGSDQISKIVHNVTVVNGRECHVYKIAGKNNQFNKLYVEIRILQKMVITTSNSFYLIN